MKKLRIIHTTQYFYRKSVKFGTHRVLVRPREGHDIHVDQLIVQVEPEASIQWMRDINENSVALLKFENKAAESLRIHCEVLVDHYDEDIFICPLEPYAVTYPFQYAAHEQLELMLFRVPSYPYDGPAMQTWLKELHEAGEVVDTMKLLNRLNTRIFESFEYKHREEHGVQKPCDTILKGAGSCRDFAVFMMEAARHWGLAARFVTGYIQMAEGQHGATHAWTEIYLPGTGWRGYDPTNNKLVGSEHVSVAVAREQEKAAPVSGFWEGDADAFDRLEVSVQVVSLGDDGAPQVNPAESVQQTTS